MSMDPDMLSRLKNFSLSSVKTKGVELGEAEVYVGIEKGQRSLIGRIFGEKKANFIGVRNTVTKLWQHKGLCKVVALLPNVFQFIFQQAEDREAVLRVRPWLFDNSILVLQPWVEGINWDDASFTKSPFWVQVWNIPSHWQSIESGMKIGSVLGEVLDVIVVDAGGKEERHLNIQVELDLTKPLVRGIRLKYKLAESWVEFRYEQLPNFCYYCGYIGHIEKLYCQRK